MIKAIISDADGTLVNTLYLIRHGQYETAVEYLIELGVPRQDIPEYDVYESFINQSVGGSTRETFERTIRMLYGGTHEQYLTKIDFDDLDSRLALIQDHIAPLYVHPFHGLTELFTWIGTSKTKIGIFTSGNPRMIVRNFGVSLPVMGYIDLFKADDIPVKDRLGAFIARASAVYGFPEMHVVTCDDVTTTKPDPEGILKLMDQLEVEPDEVLVLGDHHTDMLAARATGINPIGISHGFGTPAELKNAGAVKIVDDIASIPKIIEAHNNGTTLLFD